MILLLIRHAEPDYPNGRLMPWGIAEAEALRDKLLNYHVDEIWCTGLPRTEMTAEPLAKALGLPLKKYPQMNELFMIKAEHKKDPGIDEQARVNFVARRLAEENNDLISIDDEEQAYMLDTRSQTKQEYQRIVSGFDSFMSEQGYERETIYYQCTRENKKTVVMVAHQNANLAVLAHLLNLPLAAVYGFFRINVTGISIIDWAVKPGLRVAPVIRTINDFSHIMGLPESVHDL